MPSMDRLQGSELVMTQALIANMLGARRIEGDAIPSLSASGRDQVGTRVPTIWSYLTKCLRAKATNWFSVGWSTTS